MVGILFTVGSLHYLLVGHLLSSFTCLHKFYRKLTPVIRINLKESYFVARAHVQHSKTITITPPPRASDKPCSYRITVDQCRLNAGPPSATLTLTLSILTLLYYLHCHFHPPQAANCCRNSRLVPDEKLFYVGEKVKKIVMYW